MGKILTCGYLHYDRNTVSLKLCHLEPRLDSRFTISCLLQLHNPLHNTSKTSCKKATFELYFPPHCMTEQTCWRLLWSPVPSLSHLYLTVVDWRVMLPAFYRPFIPCVLLNQKDLPLLTFSHQPFPSTWNSLNYIRWLDPNIQTLFSQVFYVLNTLNSILIHFALPIFFCCCCCLISCRL